MRSPALNHWPHAAARTDQPAGWIIAAMDTGISGATARLVHATTSSELAARDALYREWKPGSLARIDSISRTQWSLICAEEQDPIRQTPVRRGSRSEN